jgi:hypothetical protein
LSKAVTGIRNICNSILVDGVSKVPHELYGGTPKWGVELNQAKE